MSKQWTAEAIPDLSGKTIIVTGANSGIGFEAARELARKRARVILACRNAAKAATALNEIRAQVADAAVEIMQLDLASLASIRAFASAFRERHRTSTLR